MSLNEKDLVAIGTKLRALRDLTGASAVTVAKEALGYSNGYHAAVTRLERAIIKSPLAQHIEKLAAYYGVAVTDILPDGRTLGDLAQLPSVKATSANPDEEESSVSLPPSGKDLASRLHSVRMSLELEPWEFSALVRRHGALVTQADIERWEAREGAPNYIQMGALERATSQGAGWFEHGEVTPPKVVLSGWLAFGVASRGA